MSRGYGCIAGRALAVSLWVAVVPAYAEEAPETAEQLFNMDIQALMQVDVTAVSKSATPLADTAAAVAVINREDIRRSGATNIPDLLRFVPGLQVAQLNGNQWSVGVRGFSSVYSNKLLVMVDGRTVYNPVYTGVHWDQMGLMLEDIDRIEVVRGPGATQWGSNAMNGIINIITKSAVDTQGGLLAGGGGNVETAFGGLRYGGKLGDGAYYRLYAKHSTRDNFPGLNAPVSVGDRPSFSGRDNNDRTQHDRGGFRLDWDPGGSDSVTFQGDFFHGGSDWSTLLPNWSLGFDQVNNTLENSGENLLANWKHRFSPDFTTATRVYWDHYRRLNSFYREEVETLDWDSQVNYRWNESHELVMGGGFRYSSDELGDDAGSTLSFNPSRRKISTFNIFVQDDFTLVPDTLNFLYGVKYEYNGFSGSQAQPTGRLLWKVNDENRVWAAVSHATRIPSRVDQNINLHYLNFFNVSYPNQFCPGLVGAACQYSIKGNPRFGSEKLDSFELGYRFNPNSDFSFDVSGFYNRYSDFNTRDDMGFQAVAGAPLQRVYLSHNYGRAESLGTEATANWQATSRWRLSANYSYLRLFMHKGRSNDTGAESYVEQTEAQNQVALRSLYNLSNKWELDGTLYYVDDRRYEDLTLPGLHAPSYFRLDARIGWMPRPDLELDLVGQNLLDPRHLEFVDKLSPLPSEVPRSVFARLQWHF
jgi:iron complex outermembrane receptor protein